MRKKQPIPDASREDIAQLLEQYQTPQLRPKNWPTFRATLIEAAKRYGLTLPPYLADEE